LFHWIKQNLDQPHSEDSGPNSFQKDNITGDGPSSDNYDATTDHPQGTQLNDLLNWHLRPGQLTSMIGALRTVGDKKWLDVTCINVPLSLLALESKGHMRYVPFEFHHPARALEEMEIVRYRTIFNRHQDIQAHSWVCTLVQKEGNHWFGLLGHPQRRQVFVLGREMIKRTGNISHSWQEWGGPRIWSTICKLHGWDSTVEFVQSISWRQNGYDCGPDIAHVLTTMMEYGVTPTNTGMVVVPAIPCGHLFRISAGRQLLVYAKRLMARFVDICDQNQGQATSIDPHWHDTREQYKKYIDRWAENPLWPIKRTLKKLEKRTKVCACCPQASRTTSSAMPPAARFIEMKGAKLHPGILADGMTSHSQTDDAEEAAEAGREREECNREEIREEGEDGEEDEGEEEDGNDEDDDQDGQTDDSEERDTENVNPTNLEERDSSPASAPRFGRPHTPPKVAAFSWSYGQWNNRHTHFDEYADGPVLANVAPGQEDGGHALQNIFSMASSSGKIGPEWRTDHGWRLLPDYADMFPDQRPCDVDAHLMPVMPVDQSTWEPIQVLKCGRGGKTVATTDAVDMSLLEMIQHADSVGSKDIFVTGRKDLQPNRTGASPVPWEEHKPPLVRVTLHKDECQLAEGVQTTTDIDSGIWITRRPNFKHKFGILLGPLYSSMRRPPIWKHNHLYVKLLVPQLAEDRESCLEDPEQPDRKEYWVKEFRLSQIPHISLGQRDSVFLNIFFPRLTHKRTGSRFYASMVPYHVQLLFFTELLLPTLIDEVLDAPEKVYTCFSQEHINFQNATSPKLCHLRPEQWGKLVDIIDKKVWNPKTGEDCYSPQHYRHDMRTLHTPSLALASMYSISKASRVSQEFMMVQYLQILSLQAS
jgi:hypothetical protein